MTRRRRRAILACGCAVIITGCGTSSSTNQPRHTHKATTGTAPARSTKSSDEASKPATRILSDAAAALRGARSYEMQGAITMNGSRTRLGLITTGPTSLEVAFAQGGTIGQIIELPSTVYVRGNAAFWRLHLGTRGLILADRWIRAPAADATVATSALGVFAPARFSRCLVEDHGTLRVTGTTTVDGQRAIVISDAGNAPGSSPGELAVAATGAPYPIRFTATGRQRAGGRIDMCNDGKASNTRGAITFTDYNRVPPIQPPTVTTIPKPSPTS